MRLTPSLAQQDIVDSTDEYLKKEFPISRVREAGRVERECAVDEPTWRRWAEQGFFSLGLPEDAGGLGLGPVEEFLVAEQFGRHLTPGPIASSIVAAHVAHEAGQHKLARAILDGERRVGLRVADTGYDVESGGLVLTVTSGGAEIHRVAELTRLASIDPATRLSRVVVGDRVADVATEHAQLRLWILQSAMLAGAAQAAQEQSTSYAKVRHQFGQPIGAFQAVKHRCADMAVRCYVAGAQLQLAALAIDEGWPDARFQCAAALSLALEAARANVAVNVQNHGGIGFTDEHDAGLFLKRATALAAAVGDDSSRVAALTAPEPSMFT
jgi:alkylation response protein AidB-like acyl-CoA dehydrogenase